MSENKENQTIETNQADTEQTTTQENQQTQAKKSYPYKGFLCKAGLWSILALFCLGEVGVLVLIFGLFLSFYIAIIIAGGIGITTIAIIKTIKKHRAKKNSPEPEVTDEELDKIVDTEIDITLGTKEDLKENK